MEKTDSKIRLLLEFYYPKPIQILSYIPLKSYDAFSPEKMYYLPKGQDYYTFIDDNESISLIKHYLHDVKIPIGQDIEKEMKNPLEFNMNSLEEKFNKTEEEHYAIFAHVKIDNFDFIHNYDKVKNEKEKLRYSPLLYAMKGKIQVLLFDKEDENTTMKKPENFNGNGGNNTDDKNYESAENDAGLKDDDNLNQNEYKPTKNKINEKEGKDGHWFYVTDFGRINFLSIIKYKEITINKEYQDQINNPQNNNINMFNNYNNENSLNSLSYNNGIKSITNSNGINEKKDNFQQPCQFSIFSKDSNKLISIYQPISCKYHNKSNDFWCKTCSEFCCLSCIVSSTNKTMSHENHNIGLIDELLLKGEETTKALEERISGLKNIIENEMVETKKAIANLKEKNTKMVNNIIEQNDIRESKIKKEESSREKVLASLGLEVLRIINDYHQKVKYLNFLFEKGYMDKYLSSYFIFVDYFENDLKKNLYVLERKVYKIFKHYANLKNKFKENLFSK